MQGTPFRANRGVWAPCQQRVPDFNHAQVTRAPLTRRTSATGAPIDAPTSSADYSCRTCRTHSAVLDGLCGRCWVATQSDGGIRAAQAGDRWQRQHLTSC
jgi:hypothetical protein